MNEAFAGKLRFLESHHLHLVAATAELVRCDLRGPEALAKALGVVVPEGWPPELYDHQAMHYAEQQLRDDRYRGWMFWYLILKSPLPETLVGISGFKGRPDSQGAVELGYSVLPGYRNRGLATEAALTLLEWAFSHGQVREVSAETFPHLRQSIRVLEKSGFSFAGRGSEHGVIRYVVTRANLD